MHGKMVQDERRGRETNTKEIVIISMNIFVLVSKANLLIHGHTHSINSSDSNFPIEPGPHVANHMVYAFFLQLSE